MDGLTNVRSSDRIPSDNNDEMRMVRQVKISFLKNNNRINHSVVN